MNFQLEKCDRLYSFLKNYWLVILVKLSQTVLRVVCDRG